MHIDLCVACAFGTILPLVYNKLTQEPSIIDFARTGRLQLRHLLKCFLPVSSTLAQALRDRAVGNPSDSDVTSQAEFAADLKLVNDTGDLSTHHHAL